MLSWPITPRGSRLSLHLLRHLSARFITLKHNSLTFSNLLEDPNQKQSVVRHSAEVDPAQRERGLLTVGHKGFWGIAQTDCRKGFAFGDGRGKFDHVYRVVDSSKGKVRQLAAAKSLLENGHLCSGKACVTGLQAGNSCCIQADHSTSISRLPANQTMPAGRLQSRLCKANFASWHGIRSYQESAGWDDMQASCLRSSRGCSSFFDASLLACKSAEVPPLKTRKQSEVVEADNPLTLDNDGSISKQRQKKHMLPLNDFADMLFSAVTHQDEVDMDQISCVLRFRFRRVPSENFLSDLQGKVESIMLESPLRPVVKTLLKKKFFLFATSEELQAVLKLLKNFLGSGEKACSVLARSPSILATPIERIQKMLNLILEFQIEKSACERSGNMLTFDADKAKNVLTFLTNWGVDAKCINLMIHRDARCLGWSIKEHMRPALEFLESIGLSKPEILQVMRESPDILYRPIADNLMFKHELCQKLGLNFGLAIRFTTYHSTQRFVSQFEFLRQEGFSESAIVELVQREPRILGKSREDLKVKLDYLLRTHNRDITEIIKFPACLSYSFKSRIMPRLAFLKEKGVVASFSLNYMLVAESSKFRRIFKVPDSVKLT